MVSHHRGWYRHKRNRIHRCRPIVDIHKRNRIRQCCPMVDIHKRNLIHSRRPLVDTLHGSRYFHSNPFHHSRVFLLHYPMLASILPIVATMISHSRPIPPTRHLPVWATLRRADRHLYLYAVWMGWIAATPMIYPLCQGSLACLIYQIHPDHTWGQQQTRKSSLRLTTPSYATRSKTICKKGRVRKRGSRGMKHKMSKCKESLANFCRLLISSSLIPRVHM